MRAETRFRSAITYHIAPHRAALRTDSPDVYEMICVPPTLTAGTPHARLGGWGEAKPKAFVVQAAGAVVVVAAPLVVVVVERGVQLKQLMS